MKPPTCDPSAASGEQSREQVRQQFLTACASRGDGPPPDPEAFVAAFPEPERSALRSELELLQRAHAPPTQADTIGDTRDSDAGATVDHVPAPQATADHVPAPGGTVDHVPTPEATVDHTPRESRKPRLSEIPLPETVAGYEVLDILGRGAMGVVYKARQRGLKRLVALKMILSGAHASEQDLARFRAEANAVGELKHPGIVQIYEVGEDEGRPFFSLEFVDGPSLHRKIQGTPLPPREAAVLLQKMAEAMAYAHERNIIHRDLKPANVLLTQDGEPKIGDFGLAKQIEQQEDAGLTRTGTVLGTPSYMSPEQAEGKIGEVGPLADVYSLGAILYDMLTGRPPFRGTSVLDTLQQLRTQEPVPPMQFQPGVPRDLETICLKCLQKDRSKRYASAAELAADVGRFRRGEPIKARPVSLIERAGRWCRRNKGKTAVIAAGILLVLGWGITATVLYGRENAARELADTNAEAALFQKGEADRNADEATKQKGIAEEKARVAREEVKHQRETALVALAGIGTVEEKIEHLLRSKRLALADQPEMRQLRADALADLRKSLLNLNGQIQQVAAVTFADVAAAQVIGDSLMRLGDIREAQRIYQAGHRSAQRRVEKEPDNDVARANLAVLEWRLGDALLELSGDARTAYDHYLKARALHAEIEQQPHSGDYTPLAAGIMVGHSDLRVGRALVLLGRAAVARQHLQAALANREQWSALNPRQARPRSYVMEARMWLGIAAWHLGDEPGAHEHFTKALDIGRQLRKDLPADLSYVTDYVEAEGHYGDALLRFGKTADAARRYRHAWLLLQAVLKKEPDDIAHQPLLALMHERLGIVSALLKEPTEAKVHFMDARQLRYELWDIDRGNIARQSALVQTMARSGDRENAVRNAAAIRDRMVKSPELMAQLARAFAVCSADARFDRRKNIEQALATLAGATGDDFRDAAVLETDPELARLRNEPGFQKLIARIKAR